MKSEITLEILKSFVYLEDFEISYASSPSGKPLGRTIRLIRRPIHSVRRTIRLIRRPIHSVRRTIRLISQTIHPLNFHPSIHKGGEKEGKSPRNYYTSNLSVKESNSYYVYASPTKSSFDKDRKNMYLVELILVTILKLYMNNESCANPWHKYVLCNIETHNTWLCIYTADQLLDTDFARSDFCNQ